MKKLATALVLLLLLAPLRAEQPPQQPPPQPPQTAPSKPAAAQDEFVPVDSPVSPQDAMPAPRLVAIAYAFIWIVFFGYLASLKRRLARVEREIEAVSRRGGGSGRA
jgi:CcmD family protein